MGSFRWIAALSIAVFAGFGVLLYFVSQPTFPRSSGEPIVVYCADSLRPPFESITAAYEQEFGQKVELRVNASYQLLTTLALVRDGDIFMPADDSFIELARQKDLVRETLPIATMSAVVVHNPATRAITSWKDFVSPDVELILANPEIAAIGKLTKEHLQKSNLWGAVEDRKPAFTAKVSEVASGVQLNPRGAGIVFDAVASQYPTLNVANLPELADIRANVALAVTSCSKNPTQALRFARYAAARDRGLEVLSRQGYKVNSNADDFADVPELRLFGGSMLRPAIEDTIKEFQAREGVAITTNWNGCGILVGEMKANKIPDIYFACEPRFMSKVQDLFEKPEMVSTNRLVIGIAKGNPFGIQSLKDLGQKDLKLGIGNENQCALGDLTQMTFTRTGLIGQVRKNVKKEAASGDLLITDFRAKALDAIVCYESNVTPYLNEMDKIVIDIGAGNSDCTNPLQPVAIAKGTKYPQLARRLVDAFQTPQSRERFEKLGFGWVSEKK